MHPTVRSLFFSLILLMMLHRAVQAQPSPVTSTLPEADIPKIVREIRSDNIERTIRTLVGFGTRNTLSTQTDPKRGIGAARDWLYSEFLKLQKASGQRLRVEKQTFLQPVAPRIPQPTGLTNIVAVLPGDLPEDKQRYVIVSGHYDSMCGSPTDAEKDAPGANDDASGTAAVLEIARVMVPYRYHATIVFLCVAGEEQGLLGSTYFAEQALQNKWRITAMFTNDIIGNTHGGNGTHDDRSVRVFSEDIPSTATESEIRTLRSIGGLSDSPSRQIARVIKETADKYVRGMTVNLIARSDRLLRGGDHRPFNQRGYAAVRFTEPNEDYRHQHQDVRTEAGTVYGDLPEFVDFRYVANVARINAASLTSLALAPDILQNVRLVTRLSSDTQLRWERSSDPDIAGYEIVWRATTSPVWTMVRSVGDVAEYTLQGISKDDYLFGVRAISKKGHRSPVAVAVPGR